MFLKQYSPVHHHPLHRDRRQPWINSIPNNVNLETFQYYPRLPTCVLPDPTTRQVGCWTVIMSVVIVARHGMEKFSGT